ncbi:hypothetical protein CK203_041551 [Vitis vinifera]|uniref:Uncharacterized protein n=1 Tax=Vitis vinifera TaxID=29760 RepID=A0A438I7K4_VITVI|nr:hypothetical protein CK203_041551 [Vitis vinifera]
MTVTPLEWVLGRDRVLAWFSVRLELLEVMVKDNPHLLGDSSLAAAVAMAPFDSGFDPRQRRHLIRAHLVSQLIRVQLVLLD